MRRREFLAATAGTAMFVRSGLPASGQSGAYSLSASPNGRTLRTPDGRTVFEYMTQKPADTDMSANSVCCFAPLNSPSGERLTVFGQGHRHYRGVFFGWHTVEFHELIPPPAAPAAGGGRRGGGGGGGARGGGGAGRPTGPPPPPEVLARQNQPTRSNVMVGDYWGWGRYALLNGRVIRNRDVKLVNADRLSAQLEMQNDWMVYDQTLLRESLSAAVREVPGAYVLDLNYVFTPNNVDVVLPEWSFGGFCVGGRSDAQSAYYFGPDGKVDLPNPSMVDGNTSWPESSWYGRTHVLDGKTAGYAVVNHASNPRTRWWNPPSTGNIQPSIVTYGDYKISHGQPLTLKYRLVAYDGEFSGERLNQLSNEWRTA